MALGFSISIAGPVTFRHAGTLKEVARPIPDQYLLIETDAPYLAPEPLRGRRNEPAYLVHTTQHIAALRGVSLEDVSRITTLNAKRLFGMGRMPDMGVIAYPIRESLYLNITNRCTNKCSFCIRFQSDYVKGHNLRLAHEPAEDELKDAIGDPLRYQEIVFCGYGEPLLRLDVVKTVARWVKQKKGRVRIDTNGHGNMIHGRNILPELEGIVDSISISLNAQSKETYDAVGVLFLLRMNAGWTRHESLCSATRPAQARFRKSGSVLWQCDLPDGSQRCFALVEVHKPYVPHQPADSTPWDGFPVCHGAL